MKKEIAARRNLILYHFSKKGDIQSKKGFVAEDEELDRVTCSGTADDDDEWMIGMDTATCNVTDTRHLSRYSFEHLLMLPTATKLLLLIAEADDTNVFKNRGYPAHQVQNLPTRNISGRTHLQLKCTLSDVHMNEQATKRSVKYKETTFEANVTGGRAGFKFKFDGFEKDTHITWREVLNNPSTFMFFGLLDGNGSTVK